MWVTFTAVELWFSQAFAYIFNREVASKDTKQQDFLFLVRQWHRACKFDEKGRFLTSKRNNQDSNLPMNRASPPSLCSFKLDIKSRFYPHKHTSEHPPRRPLGHAPGSP